MKGSINREQRILQCSPVSATNPSVDLFVRFKMFSNWIIVDTFKHKFSPCGMDLMCVKGMLS